MIRALLLAAALVAALPALAQVQASRALGANLRVLDKITGEVSDLDLMAGADQATQSADRAVSARRFTVMFVFGDMDASQMFVAGKLVADRRISRDLAKA